MSAPLIFDRRSLARNRARAARLLAKSPETAPDFLLSRVAEDFSYRLDVIRRSFADVADLGCHHGGLGRILKRNHAFASLTSADDCAELLAHADAPHRLIDFEHLPFANCSLDLVVSGLALHAVNDLPGTLAQVHASLRPDGLFLAALIGGRSLFELRDAFLTAEIELTGGASPRIAPAIDVRELGTLLQRARFALPVVDSDVVTVTYAHPLALMHDLRAMGATSCLCERPRTFLARNVLLRAIEIYQERHAEPDGRIRATFEIITATAWSPHANQQKPLQPGSAKTRLADVLRPPRTAA